MTNPLRDTDTRSKGSDGPFADHEADRTGLVHVLCAARRAGLTLQDNSDDIASLILRSRWFAAAKALHAANELDRFAADLIVEGPENSNDDVLDGVDYGADEATRVARERANDHRTEKTTW